MRKADHPILEYLTFRLDRLSELTKEAGTQVYESEFGISIRDLRIVRLVALEPGLTLTRLIELTMLEKTHASKLVSAMVKRGFVRREVGRADARQINLFLTADGEDLVKRTYERGNMLEQMMLSALPADELRIFNSVVDKLTAGLIEHLAARRQRPIRRSASPERCTRCRRTQLTSEGTVTDARRRLRRAPRAHHAAPAASSRTR
ncbi:MarR family winged helix-turn-helix transcriptional regulator [Burkholderia multivorans]|nr:MarR family winged helix-turn-helix transcriptional regulator [Burkholderia multivorans]MCO1357291.1 MarR family winged helix-turn-helix transcriptional regulator [Burkholderia multivorans]